MAIHTSSENENPPYLAFYDEIFHKGHNKRVMYKLGRGHCKKYRGWVAV